MKRSLLPLLIVLSLIAAPALAFSVGPFSVLGCTFNGNVGSFTSCLTTSANKKANAAAAAADKAARDALQPTIDALENSPFLAKLDAEKQLLLAARNSGIADLASCLQQAGVDLGSAITSIANDPRGIAASRLIALTEQRLAQLTPQLDAVLQRSRSFNPQSPPNPAQLADQAFAEMLAMAEHDPIAKCGKPMLLAQETAIKQSAVQLYGQLESRMNQFVSQSLEPAVRRAAMDILEQRFAPLQVAATGKGRDQSRAAAGALQQRRQSSPAAAVNMQRRAAVAAPRAKGPRTRGVGEFIEQQQQNVANLAGQVVEQAQPVVRSMLPDTVERIAHAELAGHLYREGSFRSASLALRAIANGEGNASHVAAVQRFQSRLAEREPEMYSRIALTTINVYGKETIDTVTSPIIGWVLDWFAGAIGAADGVAGVVCSTAGAITATGCLGVKEVPKFMIHSILIPIIDYALVKMIQKMWENTCECMAIAVGIGGDADSRVCRALQPLLRRLPATAEQAVAWVMPHIDESQRDLVTYHSAVLALASSSSGAGARR